MFREPVILPATAPLPEPVQKVYQPRPHNVIVTLTIAKADRGDGSGAMNSNHTITTSTSSVMTSDDIILLSDRSTRTRAANCQLSRRIRGPRSGVVVICAACASESTVNLGSWQ